MKDSFYKFKSYFDIFNARKRAVKDVFIKLERYNWVTNYIARKIVEVIQRDRRNNVCVTRADR